VIAIDTNVLVYAHRREVPEHDAAWKFVRRLAEGSTPWAIPWPCIYEFFSVVTNTRIWKSAASTPAEASRQIAAWVGSPSVRLLAEPVGFYEVLHKFLERPRLRGTAVHDARIAAICVAHGVEALVTRDRDFSMFPQLRLENPFDA
jgi:toxin-antitoxin system PIN domain toxin